MLKKTKIVGAALLIVGMTFGPAFATDYQTMTNDELAALRGSMREASQQDRDAFRSEWQNRVNSMNDDDREQAVGRPDRAARDGEGYQNRKENRGQNRNMNQSNDSGPSKAMGGGQGGGRGSGRGRS